ncbi:MAG: class I SAM-dependent rRNA methyltransferase [Cellvibrionales bacterium]|nr:class I SAM-dependent rRNA methyltransferase [Cellvibrionales bacterium]
MADYPQLFINERADKRLRSGHLWLFSNEVDATRSPLSTFNLGQQVAVVNAKGKLLGYAMVNPSQLICARFVSKKIPLGEKLIKQRIQSAYQLRQDKYKQPFYRLFYAEGDFLPGLVIDRYGSVVVTQITHQGLQPFRQVISEVLLSIEGVDAVVFRQDMKSLKQEGLDVSNQTEIVGNVPETLTLTENACEFVIPSTTGQKTGWFYDHRENRAKIAELAEGKTVLDVFSYMGGWGLACMKAGAKALTAIDASNKALDYLHESAQLNGFDASVESIQGDAFQALEALLSESQKFDIVIIDPPAFIKKKKDQKPGEKAYKKINQLGLRLVKPGGYLVAASCCMHLPAERLQQLVQEASRHVDRNLRLVYKAGHPHDHPVHPAIKETEYLKAQIYQVTR